MLFTILSYLLPAVLVGGFLWLVGLVAKRRFIDRKPISGASQMIAEQNIFDMQTDQGRKAMIEQTKMKERPAADADGEKLEDED